MPYQHVPRDMSTFGSDRVPDQREREAMTRPFWMVPH